MRRLLIIDASSFIYRGFHATAKMTNRAGQPVNAVQAFAGMLMKVLRRNALQHYHDHVIVVFEKAAKNFRHKIYPRYKAGRVRDPDLMSQFDYCRAMVPMFGLHKIEVDGYEADDVMASYAAQAPFDVRVTIASPDKDLLQIWNPGFIDILDTMAKPQATLRTHADVERLFGPGLKPHQIVDVQALCGDSVDAVPGVRGIGEKTAAALVAKLGSLEAILASPDSAFPTPRIAKLVKAGAEDARVSYKLVKLNTTMKTVDINLYKRNDPDPERLMPFFNDLGLNTVSAYVAREYGDRR